MSMDDIRARLAQAELLEEAAREKARKDSEERDRHDVLWHAVRFSKSPQATSIIDLARAVAAIHVDGERAFERLQQQYETIDVNEDSPTAFHLRKLTAKCEFCKALIEASKPAPDEEIILAHLAAMESAYANLDTEDVREELHCLRKVDARAKQTPPAEIDHGQLLNVQAAPPKRKRGRPPQIERDLQILLDVDSGLFTQDQIATKHQLSDHSAVSKAAQRARDHLQKA